MSFSQVRASPTEMDPDGNGPSGPAAGARTSTGSTKRVVYEDPAIEEARSQVVESDFKLKPDPATGLIDPYKEDHQTNPEHMVYYLRKPHPDNVPTNKYGWTRGEETQNEANRAAMIKNILGLQGQLQEMTKKVESIKSQNSQLREENQVLNDYIENITSQLQQQQQVPA